VPGVAAGTSESHFLPTPGGLLRRWSVEKSVAAEIGPIAGQARHRIAAHPDLASRGVAAPIFRRRALRALRNAGGSVVPGFRMWAASDKWVAPFERGLKSMGGTI